MASGSVNDASPRRKNSKNNNINNNISNSDSVALWEACQSDIEQFRVPESIYRRVPIEEWKDNLNLAKPALLGLFRHGSEANWDASIGRLPDTPFEVTCNGKGVSCETKHCVELKTVEELQACLRAWQTGGPCAIPTFSVTADLLLQAKEDSILSGFHRGLAGSWNCEIGRSRLKAKFQYCYVLRACSTLPIDLRGVLDKPSTGHVSITFKKDSGTLLFTMLQTGHAMKDVGIHKKLVEDTDWQLHCFRITAKADVNETVYPDPDLLQLLQCVDQYMDVCDEEEFSILMRTLYETQLLDNNQKTLKGIFVDSSHAPIFLRAINNMKESLPEEERTVIETLLQSVEELRAHHSSNALQSVVGN